MVSPNRTSPFYPNSQMMANRVGIYRRRPSGFNLTLLILPVVLLSVLTGCATSRYGRGWGQDATALPGWKRIGEAARDAALDPRTWAPTAGAAVFGLTDLDENVSDWAWEKTPLFGSCENANQVGDYLNDASAACWITTMLLAPSGDEIDDIVTAKLKGAAVEVTAVSTTFGLTEVLKHTTRRERPNEADNRSFPSLHTSSSFVCSSMACTNLDWFDMNAGLRTTLQCGVTTLAVGTGWARVECGAHYPSDVLFGAALGNFLSVFFTKAFLGTEDNYLVSADFAPTSGGAKLSFNVLF